jgi:hypothetical protein
MKKLLLLFFLQAFAAAAVKAQYAGGTGNGFWEQAVSLLNLSLADSLYNGGTGRGDQAIISNGLLLGINDSLYNGGTGKGDYVLVSNSILLGMADSLYNGGTGKGDIRFTATGINLAVCSDTLYWNGNDNLQWHNPANWDCGTVPGINSIAVIPPGRPRYPVITINTEIKKLDIQPGAAVLVIAGTSLIINGH